MDNKPPSEWTSRFVDRTSRGERAYHTLDALLLDKGRIVFVGLQLADWRANDVVAQLLYLANVHITKKWTKPLMNWPLILNQLAIRFEGRFPL